jgi:hypothetical protein
MIRVINAARMRAVSTCLIWLLIPLSLVSCAKPRIREQASVLNRRDAELIVVGKVVSVGASRLKAILNGNGVRREDVCLEVLHSIKGGKFARLCFVQFTSELPFSRQSAPPELEEGVYLLAFLSMDDGIWRPMVDYERVWIELSCAEVCREPLAETTIDGKLAEVILRRAANARYPIASKNLWVLVQNARTVTVEPFIRRAVERLARLGSVEERNAACAFLKEQYHVESCTWPGPG